MINLKSVLSRIDKGDLIKLLPLWQKAYFSSLSISVTKENIAEFFLANKHELLNQKRFLILLNFLKSDEITLLRSILEKNKISYFEFKKNLMNEMVDEKKFNKILIDLFKEDEENQINEVSIKKTTLLGPEKRFFELLDYQVYIKEQLLSILNEPKERNRLLVHMPTGSGKTKTTMHTLIEYFLNSMKKKGLIVWIAHTNTLLEQAEETFEIVWNAVGHREIQIHRLYDNNEYYGEIIVDGIAFISVAKLISLSKKNEQLLNFITDQVRLIIFDEAHKITATETSVAVKKIFKYIEGNQKRLIGLTATPGRHNYNDFANENLADFFDNRIVTINPMIIEQLRVSMFKAINQELSHLDLISYFQERKILSKLVRENIEYDVVNLNNELNSISKKTKQGDYSSDVIRVVSQDLNRNITIIEKLLQLYNQGKQVIFFACGIDHGKFICSILKFYGVSASEIYGSTQSDERIATIRKFRAGEIKIIVNCGVLTTGFDSTNIDCVFISRPTSSIVLYSQMIGRGLRGPKMGGNEYCLLVDLKDNLDKYSDDNEIFNYFRNYWRG